MPDRKTRRRTPPAYLTLRRETLGAVAVLLAAAILTPYSLRHRVDNRIEAWVKHDSAEAARYQKFRDRFGSDEIVVVEYAGKPLFDVDSLRTQSIVLAELEDIPEVEFVAGIPVVYRDIFNFEDRDELEAELTNTEFYRNFIISADATVAGMILETRPPDDIDGRRRLVRQIESAVATFTAEGWTAHVVGPPVLNVSLDDTSRREALRLIPLSLALSAIVLALFLQSLRAVVVGLVCAAVTLSITVGTMAAFDRPMNMVTTSMPALVWVLSLAGLIHVLHAYLTAEGPDIEARLNTAIAKTRRACLISSVTTAVGFFSLAAAPMNPVRDFGLFAGFGLLVSLFVTFTLAPVLVGMLRIERRKSSGARILQSVVDIAGYAAISRPLPIVLGAAICVAVALSFVPKLRTETNLLNFLPADSDIARAYRTVPKELTGLYTLEVLVDTPQSWLEPGTLHDIDELAGSIEAMPEVARVLSPLSYLRKLNQWDQDFDPTGYVLPDSPPEARRLIAEADNPARLARFATSDETSVRLAALVKVMNSSDFDRLERRVEALPEYRQLGAEMTGIIRQIVSAQDALVTAQVRSLLIAFALIFPCIFLGIRSWSLTALSLLLNAIPVLAAFALMAIARIPLDAATVMVAGIAIGIAVDDTVHIVCAYQEARTQHSESRAALRSAMAQVGPSITITTITSLSGFLILLRSEFVPLQHFGLIAGAAMVVALVADVFVLPATLALFSPRGKRATEVGRELGRGRPADTV